MKLKCRYIVLLLIACVAIIAAQDIYTYVDENGTIHYTDQPQAGWHRVILGSDGEVKLAESTSVRVITSVSSSTPYANLINKASARYKLDARLIASVIRIESSFQPDIVSHANAKGLMQLIDITAKQYNVTNVFDPAQNIDAGSRHLRNLVDAYNGNVSLALAAYNAGQGAVAKYGGVPPYKETRRYIQKIAKVYGDLNTTISDVELASSYVAARILARGERFLYRYETANGIAYSEVEPEGINFVRIDLLK